MSSLRKRKWSNGKTNWSIRFRHEGKMRSYTIGETDRRTAEKIKHQFDIQFAQGIVPESGERASAKPAVVEPTVVQLRKLTREFAETNKDPLTLQREQDALGAVINVLGDIKLSDLTPAKIESYKTKRLKNVAAATVNIEIRVLNTALAQAFTLGWLTEKHKYRFKQIQITDPEAPEVLTEEEIQRVLQTDDFEFQQFLSFLLLTGCRRNEALGIRWEDIDFTKRQMLIRGEIGKMGKRRTSPISKALAMVLISAPGDHSGLLFPNYRPNQVSMKFRRWIRQLGMRKGISLHSLRSTFACHLIQNGIDIYLVSRLLGHSSVKVTEKHYLTLNSDDASAAVESLTYVRVSANGSSIEHGEELAVSS